MKTANIWSANYMAVSQCNESAASRAAKGQNERQNGFVVWGFFCFTLKKKFETTNNDVGKWFLPLCTTASEYVSDQNLAESMMVNWKQQSLWLTDCGTDTQVRTGTVKKHFLMCVTGGFCSERLLIVAGRGMKMFFGGAWGRGQFAGHSVFSESFAVNSY